MDREKETLEIEFGGDVMNKKELIWGYRVEPEFVAKRYTKAFFGRKNLDE